MVVEKKFCTACQYEKPLEGGIYKKNKIVRWVCKQCVNRMSESKYAKREGTSCNSWNRY